MNAGHFEESARSTPIWHECDVCVVGGSCTGLFAAVRAARLGARVAIIEQQNCFGGVATNSMVNVWHSLLDAEYGQPIIAGLTQEVVERLERRDAITQRERNPSLGYIFNSEELKLELDQLAAEARLKIFFHTQFVAPHRQNGRLAAIIVENKSGRGAIQAAMFVDATGDGDLAARLGLPVYRAPHPQPSTTCARFSGWETLGGLDVNQVLQEGFVWKCQVPGSTVQLLAGTRIAGKNPADADDLTAAEIEGRRQVRQIMDALRAAVPASRLVLQALPSRIGLRESLHVRCRYQLTGADLLSGQRFPDAIANGSYRVDIHHPDRPGITLRYLDGHEEYWRPGCPSKISRWRPETPTNPTYYQIPFRSLVPGTVPNLIVAGRMLDADPIAFGAVRVMVTMSQTGEAAGVAAWLALQTGTAIADVDPGRLRRELAAGGSIML